MENRLRRTTIYRDPRVYDTYKQIYIIFTHILFFFGVGGVLYADMISFGVVLFI